MKTQTQEQIKNGVNVTKLGETVEMITNDPEMGQFKARVKNKWLGADQNRFMIKDFYLAKQNMDHAQTYSFDAGEPVALLGQDKGANPVEYLLGALSSCMTTTLAYKSAGMGREIENIQSEYEGDIDLRGLLEIDETVDPGFSEIRVKFKIKGDISEEEAMRLVKSSPVYDTLVRPIKVKVMFEKD